MEQTFLTAIEIKKVRHLQNITIPLDQERRKHLILTGKNGSGKTSVLEALAEYISVSVFASTPQERIGYLEKQTEKRSVATKCTSFLDLREKYDAGKFVFA